MVFGGSTTSGNDEGLWTAVSSPSQTLKIREGNATGISQVNFGQPLPYTDSINGLGDTLSGVNLAGSGAPNGTKQSLWANTGGALQLITREGALAHDSAPLTFYRQVFYPSVINDALDVAYFAGIDGNETGVGLWTGNISGGTPSGQMSSAPMRIALNGEQAAGLPAGVIYDQLDTGNTGNGMGLNGLGSVLFSGRLNGPGVTGSNDFAIWLYEKEWDQVFLVAREGDEIQVGPNDTRTVANFGYFGTFGQDDGRLESLNDSDQIAMTLSFTDGSSGVFVASKVPEPTSRFFALVAWISLSLVARRPRRGRPLSANDRDP